MYNYLKRAWAEIDLNDLEKNLNELLRVCGTSQPVAVVKANAYGHDDRSIAPFLERKGISFFAVSNIKEAITLRECGVKGEILILGYTPPDEAEELAKYDIIQAAVSLDHALRLDDEAKKAGVRVKLHMAVDTGMGRIGESGEKAVEALVKVSSLENIILDGAFTHFAVADTLSEDEINYTSAQRESFFKVISSFESKGKTLRHKHCLNSAGGIFHYDSRSTLVRNGIVLYGLKPDISLELPFRLHPVMSLKAVVSLVKEVPAGTYFSYGRTYRSEGTRKIATIPIGYADGYPRSLSGKGEVLIRGKRAPITGRICMDQLMCDVTDIEGVCVEDTATLIGTDGNETITADDIAVLSGTIGYEIVCGISKRVPRVIIENGETVSVREYY